MIMAGRGQRLMNVASKSKLGVEKTFPEDETVDLPSIVRKINEIDTRDINPSSLLILQNQFKQLLTSKSAMRDILSDLHVKALQDADFGEKLIVALEQVLSFEIEGTLLRDELLSFIQNDFNQKETTSQTDPKKFVNSVLLLGSVFHRIKVCGTPIAVLGVALLEYFDLLLKGNEEQLKTLTKQILINGSNLSESNKYQLLEQNLRNTLVTKNLDCPSKCWLLLAIDFMSNGLKPLKETLREFYVSNLGNEFKDLERFIKVADESVITSPSSSPGNVKIQDNNVSPKGKNFNTSPSKSDNIKKDLSKKFSDMSVKSGSAKKEKTHFPSGKNNKKDMWKSSGTGKGVSGHDDRFEKEENFYGVQKPRELKPESQKKKIEIEKNDA